MWAAMLGNEPVCRALLDAKADVNTPSQYGTALLPAEFSGNVDLVKMLFDHGAKFTNDRINAITPLMTAAENNRLDMLRLLLDHGAKVNDADDDGVTALMYAARAGRTEAATLLLQAGAQVDTTDSHDRTALMAAAQAGYPDLVRLLLAHHADVNRQDKAGDTPLLLAARYSGVPEIARLLIQSGAKADVKNARGLSALDTARTRRRKAFASAMGTHLSGLPTEKPLSERARAAVERGLPLVQMATKKFSSQATCISCHHQGLGMIVTGFARDHGFQVDASVAESELKKVTGFVAEQAEPLKQVLPNPALYKFVPAVDMEEFADGMSFMSYGLLMRKTPPNETLSAIAVILADQQKEDGRWSFLIHREPVQSSPYTMTALAVRVLQAYMPQERAAETDRRIAKATQWLMTHPGATTEDRAFRLLGLKWAGAPQAQIDQAAAELRKSQRPDGGGRSFRLRATKTTPTLAATPMPPASRSTR